MYRSLKRLEIKKKYHVVMMIHGGGGRVRMEGCREREEVMKTKCQERKGGWRDGEDKMWWNDGGGRKDNRKTAYLRQKAAV